MLSRARRTAVIQQTDDGFEVSVLVHDGDAVA
jgi:hypothetical protein